MMYSMLNPDLKVSIYNYEHKLCGSLWVRVEDAILRYYKVKWNVEYGLSCCLRMMDKGQIWCKEIVIVPNSKDPAQLPPASIILRSTAHRTSFIIH